MVSMLGLMPSCCIACLPKVWKKKREENVEKKNNNDTDFWKDVVQVSDDAMKKMLL